MREFVAELRIAVVTTIVLVVLLCGVYPAVVRALAWAFFPETSGGSLVERQGKVLGSKLLGQEFAGAKYFHGRPSAAGAGYDGTSSGGSNLGPLSRDLIDAVGRRAANYRSENNLAAGAAVPVDAVTASGSGLDPHISVSNALLQMPRVAKARGLGVEEVRRRMLKHTEGRDLRIFGEPRVNVLMLNLDLDG